MAVAATPHIEVGFIGSYCVVILGIIGLLKKGEG
jgi:hypothetical protein